MDEGNDGFSEDSAEIPTPCPSSEEDEANAESNTKSFLQECIGNVQPKPSNTTKLRKRLQERRDVLRSATFTVDDSAVLENALTMVDAVLKELQQSASHENGLPLRQSPEKKKLKITQVDFHKVKHKSLPIRRRHNKRRKDRGVVVYVGRDEGISNKDNGNGNGGGWCCLLFFFKKIKGTYYPGFLTCLSLFVHVLFAGGLNMRFTH